MRICVFCGSSFGRRESYEQAARTLGRHLAEEGIGLVYGGAHRGLMGVLADAVLDAGGDVIGVIPQALVERDIAHTGLKDLRVVESMHERKATMAALSDGFIAMPGGLGTLEELFEVWTWGQLGFHEKPCALLDVDGYYAGLLGVIEHMVGEGFVKPECRSMVIVDHDPRAILRRFSEYRPPAQKWDRGPEMLRAP